MLNVCFLLTPGECRCKILKLTKLLGGGKGWGGATTCVSGFVCTVSR